MEEHFQSNCTKCSYSPHRVEESHRERLQTFRRVPACSMVHLKFILSSEIDFTEMLSRCLHWKTAIHRLPSRWPASRRPPGWLLCSNLERRTVWVVKLFWRRRISTRTSTWGKCPRRHVAKAVSKSWTSAPQSSWSEWLHEIKLFVQKDSTTIRQLPTALLRRENEIMFQTHKGNGTSANGDRSKVCIMGMLFFIKTASNVLRAMKAY